MRGVAALSVVPLHSADFFGPLYWSSGYLAVDFFFLLSGFIIANAYEGRLRSGMGLLEFFEVRFVRFYPLYFLGLLLGLLVAIAAIFRDNPMVDPAELPVVVAFGLLMLPMPGLQGSLGYPLNRPSWTLFLEMAVNMLYAAILPWLGRRTLIAIVVLGAVGEVAAALEFGTLHVGWKLHTLWGGIPRVMFAFFLGVLLFRTPSVRIGRQVPPWTILLALGAILSVVPSAEVRPYYDLFAVLLAFPLLLLIGAENEPARNTRGAYAFLGATSYAVYAIHSPLYILTHGALNVLQVQIEAWFPYLGIGFWALLLLSAWLADRHYDLPVRRSALSRLRRSSPSA
jgi:peptidoglycan/LPS O-acetylase OafA/YrhL